MMGVVPTTLPSISTSRARLDDQAVDLPAGGLEPLLRLADRLADLAARAAPTEHERSRHGPATGSPDPVDPGVPNPRLGRHSGPARKAAVTIMSHAVPARNPPATSVK